MTRSSPARRGVLLAASVVQLVVGLGLGALGWGGIRPLLGHPARAALVVLSLLFTAAALVSPINLSSGKREDIGNRWIFPPLVGGTLLLCWLVPYLDRRDVLTLDGDAVRYGGVFLLAVGGILRIWPMFVLGRQFSGLVAIQRDHRLVTRGPYRYVRNPSYLGGLIAFVGWALVFRSIVGVVACGLGFGLLRDRIDAEEALLASEFGAAYEEYRRRTWRLVPGVY